MHFEDEVIENVAESIITCVNKYLIPLGEFLIFKFLFTYNECLAFLQVATWYLKRECYLFVVLSDFIYNLFSLVGVLSKYIIAYFLHSYMEPFYINWLCIVEIGEVVDVSANHNSLFFVEQYTKLNIGYNSTDFDVGMHIFSKKYLQQTLNNAKCETLILMRLHGDYIVRVANDRRTIYPTGINAFKQSNVEFLSILYSHPTTLKVIEIRLPRGIYKVGNELLSISHVKRCIAYSSLLPTNIPFDRTYKLYIIDHNAMRFEIGAGEYVIIEEDNYKIMKHEKLI